MTEKNYKAIFIKRTTNKIKISKIIKPMHALI